MKRMKWYKRFGLKEVLKSNFKNGAIYYLWGNPYRLIIRTGRDDNIEIENENLIFSVSSLNSVEEKRFEYDFEEYCNIFNVKKEIL